LKVFGAVGWNVRKSFAYFFKGSIMKAVGLICAFVLVFFSSSCLAYNQNSKIWADKNGGIRGWAKCSTRSIWLRAFMLRNKVDDPELARTVDTLDFVMRGVRRALEETGNPPGLLDKVEQAEFNAVKVRDQKTLVNEFVECTKSL